MMKFLTDNTSKHLNCDQKQSLDTQFYTSLLIGLINSVDKRKIYPEREREWRVGYDHVRDTNALRKQSPPPPL